MSKKIESLYRLEPKDLPRSGKILADAFQNDPVWNKLFANIRNSDRVREAFFETPVRVCRRYGEVYAPSHRLEGIAAWTPGIHADMTIWRIILSGAYKSAARIGANVSKTMMRAFLPVQQDRKVHMAGRDYYYLQIVGVQAELQGQGYGGKLIGALLESSDSSGIPVYLETETEENVAMYRRYGFEVLGEIILPELDLPMWKLVREPKETNFKK